MKVHKIDFAEEAFNRPEDCKPPLVEGYFYLKATYVCSECEYKEDVLINRDKEVYHECNYGNRRTIVPELKIPTQKDPNQNLLNRGSK
jgi:hypothetical protein